MRVHSALGNGFPEVIYQRSLALELKEHNLGFAQDVHLPVYYKSQEVGSRRADFLVEGAVLIDLKALPELQSAHHAQIINYLNAYKLEVGL